MDSAYSIVSKGCLNAEVGKYRRDFLTPPGTPSPSPSHCSSRVMGTGDPAPFCESASLATLLHKV
jgi:hypothetical protein